MQEKELVIKIKTNLIGGLSSILFSIALWIIIPLQIDLTRDNSSRFSINAQFLPKLAAIVICVLGIALILQSLVFKKEKIYLFDTHKELRPLLFCLIIIAYVILIPIIGFLVSSILMSCGGLLFLRTKKILYYIIALVSAAVIYITFSLLLNVSLP